MQEEVYRQLTEPSTTSELVDFFSYFASVQTRARVKPFDIYLSGSSIALAAAELVARSSPDVEKSLSELLKLRGELGVLGWAREFMKNNSTRIEQHLRENEADSMLPILNGSSRS